MGQAIVNTDAIKDTAKDLKNNAKDAANTFKNGAKDVLQESKSFGQDLMHTASEKLSAGYDTFRGDAEKMGSQLMKTVKKHPLLAVGVAVGAGWLVSRLFSSRRQEA